MAERGDYLIRDGAIVSVDPTIGDLARGSILVRDGVIVDVGEDVDGAGRRGDRRLRDARHAGADRLAPPPVECDRSELPGGGLRVLPGEVGDVGGVRARRLLQQRPPRPRRVRARRHHHRAQLVAQHAHAGPRRRRAVGPPRRARSGPLLLRPSRPAAGRGAARLHRHRSRRRGVVRSRSPVGGPGPPRRQPARAGRRPRAGVPSRDGRRASVAACRSPSTRHRARRRGSAAPTSRHAATSVRRCCCATTCRRRPRTERRWPARPRH